MSPLSEPSRQLLRNTFKLLPVTVGVVLPSARPCRSALAALSSPAAAPRREEAAVPPVAATAFHTVALADDHTVVRMNLKKLLAREADFRLVAEADNGCEALRLVTELQPEPLVTDLAMPGLDGIEVTRAVRRASPNTRVIVISVHQEEPYVMRALEEGARGYVLKNHSGTDLIAALRAVLAGGRYLSPSFSPSLLD